MNSIQFQYKLVQYKLGTLLFVCLFALGCSDKVGVTGTVTYVDEDGKVVKRGEVTFLGEKELGRAVIKDGKFSVGLAKDGEGLRPGTYVISSEQLPPPVPAEAIPPGGSIHDIVDIYYLEEPITVEIKKKTVVDFAVKRGVRPGTSGSAAPVGQGAAR